MKKIMLFMALLVSAAWVFTSCGEEDGKKSPTLSFAKSTYAITGEEAIVVELQSSVAVTENTTVRFTLSGAAVENTDYTISAHEFVLKVGESKATVEVKPKGNYPVAADIKLELLPVSGFELGRYKTATLAVESGENTIYSFVTDYNVLAGELFVEVELKNALGNSYIATEDISLPFVVSEESTAVRDADFSIEGNVSAFIIPKGKKNASIKIEFIKHEEGKDLLVLQLQAPNVNFIPGNYDKMKIKIYGPTTVGKLFGKWVFKGTTSFDDIKNYYGGSTAESDFVNMPINNSNSDTLEFVAGEKDMLKLHVTGDMKNYFRDCEISYVEDRTVQDPYNGEKKTLSFMELSSVNVKFSANTKEERKAEVGFRVLEDGTLEVTVMDYAPVDFFQGILEVMGDMSYTPIIYHFTKVKE